MVRHNSTSFASPVGPKINRDDVYRNKIHCRVGRLLRLEDVGVEGEPPAKVTWSFKGVDQSTLQDVEVKNPDYKTSIYIKNAQRAQSGMYLIKAINEYGEDECEVRVRLSMMLIVGYYWYGKVKA